MDIIPQNAPAIVGLIALCATGFWAAFLKLSNWVSNEITDACAKLHTEIQRLEARVAALEDERDYARGNVVEALAVLVALRFESDLIVSIEKVKNLLQDALKSLH